MARRSPGISPILSARGFGARVLWPKYTPSGGVNSGSEVPAGPSDTLQSNNSNLIATYSNPFGVYEEEIEPGIVFEPYVSDTALYNPARHRSQLNAKQRAAKRLAKGRRAFMEKSGAPQSRAARGYEDQYGNRIKFGEELDNPFSGPHQEAFYAMARHNPAEKFEVRTKRGKTMSMSRAQVEKMGSKMLAPGEVERVRREAKKAYGKDLGEISEIKPGQMMSTWSNPGADGRFTPDELAALKVKAVAMLESKVPHAKVREQLGLTFPKYMAVLRSGVAKRGPPTHVPDSPSHFLRMPIDERKDKRKQAIGMLKAGKKHEDVRKSLGVGYKTYLGILRSIPNPHHYEGYHELMSNPAVMRMNPFGG